MSDNKPAIPQTYGIKRWGDGYFQIGSNGHVLVQPNPDRDTTVDLYELAIELGENGLSLPVLVRFTDILYHRVSTLCSAFGKAFEEFGFNGAYTSVYPIKVNQQHIVVQEILAKGEGCVGLEAGSKPELMAVLALSRPGGVIVCNGYKDREYIRLALIGLALGHRVYIVIEKPSELDLVMQEAVDLDIEPLLGVRVRLAASAAGNWQNSGGDKSKFGLAAMQVLELIDKLKQANLVHRLQLLHAHIGSQIPNLRDIRRGTGEMARVYRELRRLGADIQVVDVGGGLGIDYDGSRTTFDSSIVSASTTFSPRQRSLPNRAVPLPHTMRC